MCSDGLCLSFDMNKHSQLLTNYSANPLFTIFYILLRGYKFHLIELLLCSVKKRLYREPIESKDSRINLGITLSGSIGIDRRGRRRMTTDIKVNKGNNSE